MKKHSSLIVWISLLILIFAGSSCTTPRPQAGYEKADVYLVPFDEFPATIINELAEYYEQKLKLAVSLLPGLSITAKAVNNTRRQVIAEELIELIKAKYQHLTRNSKSIIIGLTMRDMHIRHYDWQFAFSFRGHQRYAVVSSARMDPINLGDEADYALMKTRIRKMTTKNIGILFYGMPLRSDPNSVLYNRIDGIEELDAMGEDF